jgi:hypothetical protein
VSEGGGGGGIGKIIGGHVDGLNGGNGSLGGGGNTLLKPTHIGGEGGLVSDSGGNTSKKGGHFGTGLGETKDVIDEEKNILSLLVTEVLCNGKSGKGDTGTGTWGLVHLSVDESSLGSLGGSGLLVDLDDSSLNHFVVKIVTLTSTLSDSSEHRISSMVHGNVVNEFHDNDGLSDSSTSEEANLSSLGIRSEEIDNLDSGHENLLTFSLLSESGSGPVEGGELLLSFGEDGSLLVNWLTNDVDDTAESFGSHGHLNRSSSIFAILATDKSVGGFHGNGTDGVLSKMLCDLENETIAAYDFDLKSVENLRKFLIELNINDGSNYLSNLSDTGRGSGATESTGTAQGGETSGGKHGLYSII